MKQDFNLEYSFGDDLREIPKNPVQFDLAIEFLLKELNGDRGKLSLAKTHSKLGGLLRIRARVEESLNHHLQAQLLLDGLREPRLYLVNQIRLATAHQFAGSFSLAISILDRCIEEISGENELGDLLDFAHQHLGKVYLESGDHPLAEAHFESALDLRLIKNDQDLIRSSRIALDALSSKL